MAAVRGALLRQPGVHSVEVSLAEGVAVVVYDPQQVLAGQLVGAIPTVFPAQLQADQVAPGS